MPLPSQIYASGIDQAVEKEVVPGKETIRIRQGEPQAVHSQNLPSKSGGPDASMTITLTDSNELGKRNKAVMNRAMSGDLNPDSYEDAEYMKANGITQAPKFNKDSQANKESTYQYGPTGKMSVVTVPSSGVDEYKTNMRRQMERTADMKPSSYPVANEAFWRDLYIQQNPGIVPVEAKQLSVPRSVTYGEGGTVTLDRSPEDKIKTDANQAKLKKDSDVRGMFK